MIPKLKETWETSVYPYSTAGEPSQETARLVFVASEARSFKLGNSQDAVSSQEVRFHSVDQWCKSSMLMTTFHSERSVWWDESRPTGPTNDHVRHVQDHVQQGQEWVLPSIPGWRQAKCMNCNTKQPHVRYMLRLDTTEFMYQATRSQKRMAWQKYRSIDGDLEKCTQREPFPTGMKIGVESWMEKGYLTIQSSCGPEQMWSGRSVAVSGIIAPKYWTSPPPTFDPPKRSTHRARIRSRGVTLGE